MPSATFTQDNRPMGVTTALGKDVLLLEQVTGGEGVSRLFRFELWMLAKADATITFSQILGQPASVRLDVKDLTRRHFHGIVSRFVEGEKVVAEDGRSRFIRYKAEVVPKVWLLTKNAQSRIFQQMTVPDILKQVFTGYDVAYEIQGTYEPRDYCVQYRETDFAFASRLMEEEGIYYFFKHTESAHQMVLADTAQSHPDILGTATILFNELTGTDTTAEGECVQEWRKVQEIRSGKGTLWDYCFEMPDKHLEATQTILGSVTAGTVSHSLKVGGNDALEVYDHPGRYAQRFDGIAPGGGDRAADLQKIFTDNTRTVGLRMQEEAWPGLVVEGESDVRLFTAGHKFTLSKHSNGNGAYVLTAVDHAASIEGSYTSGVTQPLTYRNHFQAIPSALPFRPARVTPKARVEGPHTAVVVGPPGEEIFTDKYGRIKVQFQWDRQGQKNASSSCWVRVASFWAGQQWGGIHIPRIGQEVLVAFEEGDPDQPVVVGSLYNANQMPPYTLPDNKTQSGVKSRSSLKGTATNFNELRFEDKKGTEHVYFHAEKDFTRVVENNDVLQVGYETLDGPHKSPDGSQTIKIYKDRTETIETGHETITIKKGNRTETLEEGDETVTLSKGSRTHNIKTDDTRTIEGKQTLTVTGNRAVTVKTGNETIAIQTGNRDTKIDTGNDTTKLALGKSTTEAMQSIELKVGANSIKIDQSGITLKAMQIKLEGSIMVQIKAPIVQVDGSGMVMIKGGITMIN